MSMVLNTARVVRAVLLACGMLMAPQALAQGWGPMTQAALDKMTPTDRANALDLLQTCGDLFEQTIDARRAEAQPGSQMPDRAQQRDTQNHYIATFGPGWDLKALENSLAANNEDLRRGAESNGWVLRPGDIAAKRSTICLTSRRIEQVEGAAASSVAAVGIGPETTKKLAQMNAEDRRDNAEILQRCSQAFENYGQAAKSSPTLAHLPANYMPDMWAAQRIPLMSGATAAQVQNLIQVHQADMGIWKHPEDIAREKAFRCMADARLSQIFARGQTSVATPATSASMPTMTELLMKSPDEIRRLADESERLEAQRLGKPGAYGDGAYGPRAKAALDALLAPGAPKAKPNAPMLDYAAVEDGGPVSEQSRRDNAKAQQDFEKTKSRKLHNRENDATDCIKVEPTGVREEWGMEGRFRLRNTCSYPVEASWCANAAECSTGRGNTWKIPASKTWPIFFADPSNPQIGIGACRTGADAKPLASDAAIAVAGGVNTSHKQPTPAPGVSVMPSHQCE
ncbi:MAG: hypothetical protein QM773_16845 [Hyphomonadaceae bacterium]